MEGPIRSMEAPMVCKAMETWLLEAPIILSAPMPVTYPLLLHPLPDPCLPFSIADYIILIVLIIIRLSFLLSDEHGENLI